MNTTTHIDPRQFSGPRRLALIGAGLAVTIAACGGSDDATPAEPAAAPATETPAAATPTAAAVTAGATDLGEVLVGDDGLTVYGFTNDVDATSTCYGTCAEAWPPVIVGEDWSVAPGLDAGIFATTVRDDGSLQLVAGKWPLYYFAGDAAAGDTAGQNSGEVWFAVGTDGVLIQDEAAAPADDAEESAPADEAAATAEPSIVQVATSDLGDILVDEAGLTLYGFTPDAGANPTCEGDCAGAWPPILVDELPADLDPTVFSTATRPDGTTQLVAGQWPLYLFAGDSAPGDVTGQGSGDVWFAVNPDGGLIGAPAMDAMTDVSDEAAATAEPSIVQVASTDLGDVLADAGGFTLYGFTPDAGANPTCEGDCAGAWPPILVDELPADLDPTVFSTATRPDGTTQLVAGQWPLYKFAGDIVGGDTTGQGSGDVWFAVAPDGSLIGAGEGLVAPAADEQSSGGYDY